MISLRLLLAVGLLAVTIAAQVPFGTATPLGEAPLRIRAESPWLGNPGFGYLIEGGPPNAQGLLAVSALSNPMQLGGVRLLVDLAPASLLYLQPFTLGNDGTTFVARPLTGLSSAAVAGLSWYAQAAVALPAGPPLSLSNGVQMELSLPRQAYLVGPSVQSLVNVQPIQVAGTFTLPSLPVSALYANAGRDLLLASGAGLLRIDATTPNPVPLPVPTNNPGGFYGLREDPLRQRIGFQTYAGEIGFMDANPASPTYGQTLSLTSGLSAVTNSSWDLSADGTRALVSFGSIFAFYFIVIDVDPASPWFQTVISSGPAPPYAGGLTSTFLSGDGRFINFGRGGTLHRYHIDSQAFVDHNPQMPGVQPIGPESLPPVSFLYAGRTLFASDGSFGLLAGSNGQILRIDFPPSPAAPITVTPTPVPVAPSPLAQELLPDRRTIMQLQGAFGYFFPAQVQFFDLATGAPLNPAPVTVTVHGSIMSAHR